MLRLTQKIVYISRALRRRGIFCVAVGLLATGVVCSAQERLRIATYNVRNYLIMDRQVGDSWRPEYPKPEKEKAAARALVLEVRPDILLLQEMGPIGFLKEFQADLRHAGLDYPHAVLLEAEDRERHLAVLSRIAPEEIVRHDDLDFKYFDRRELVKRGMLELSFRPSTQFSFQIFNIHLKSRFSEEPRDPLSAMRREREARACRNRVIERTLDRAQRNFIVAGDLNSSPSSAPWRRFQSRGDVQIAQPVTARDSRGEHWTYFYRKQLRYETVDAFFASPSMMERIAGREGTIADGPEAMVASDHRMLYIDLDLTE